MKTIYVDEMLLLNLVINYLLLLTTARLCALPQKRLRFALAALLGAGYSVLVLLPALAFLATPVMKLLLAAAMTLISFSDTKNLLRPYIVFLSVSAAFGGAVLAVSLLSGESMDSGFFISASLKTLILTFGAAYFVFSLVFSRIVKRRARETFAVSIEVCGRGSAFTALRDTGNELHDPLSGLAIMVLGGDEAMSLLPEESRSAFLSGAAELMSSLSPGSPLYGRLRLVPYKALGSSFGLLPVIKPDSLIINGRERKDLLVGLTPMKFSEYDEYSAVISD